jgi:O-antigen ligase
VWPLLLLIGLAPLSAAWSVDPMLTLRKSVLLIAESAIAIYLGERYTVNEFARILAKVLCLTIAASILLYFVAPNYVMDLNQEGAWRGLSVQKNAFGMHMATAVLLLLLVRFRRYEWLRYFFLCTAFVMMLLSRSMTSVATGLLIIILLPLWKMVRLPAKQRLFAYLTGGAVVVGAGYLFAQNSAAALGLMGRDWTLTGRTVIWEQILVAIGHRPLLGYGFESFWTGLKGESLDVIVASGWIVPTAHNGFLELLLGFGLLGAWVFLIALVVAFRNGIEFIRLETGSVAYWPVAFFCFFLVHNLAESDLMANGSPLGLTIFITICTALALEVRSKPECLTEPLRSDPYELSATLVGS